MKIRKCVYNTTSKTPLKWEDVKKIDLQDNDEVFINVEDVDFSGDLYFTTSVYRMVEESQEETEARRRKFEEYKKQKQEERFQQYLELKKEFEEQKTVFKEFQKYQELDHLKLNENEYHLKCSCRPENGGSGVCGCILGSKFIISM